MCSVHLKFIYGPSFAYVFFLMRCAPLYAQSGSILLRNLTQSLLIVHPTCSSIMNCNVPSTVRLDVSLKKGDHCRNRELQDNSEKMFHYLVEIVTKGHWNVESLNYSTHKNLITQQAI